ncbi:MAG: substrate-binding domain-containing protein [Bacteroidota bacterium]
MRIIKIIISILVFANLISCTEQKTNLTIGFLVDSFETARWQKDKKYFIEKVKEMGGKVIVKSANGDEALQYSQAMELIEQGVKVLVVVATNANTAAAIVRDAHKKNVKVIAYARIIKNCDLDYFITFNVEKIGELQADYVLNLVPKGNYVLINGDKSDVNAIIEHNGVMNSLKPEIDNENIKLIYDGYIEAWSPKDAEFTMNKVIKLCDEKIDAVIVGNDGMAGGVYSALANQGLSGEVLITGLDAEAIACKRILNGDQAMTVYMSIKELAYANAELAIQLVKNQKITEELSFINNGRIDVPSIILEPQIVDKSNIESTVIAEEFLTMEEIDKSSY